VDTPAENRSDAVIYIAEAQIMHYRKLIEELRREGKG
jgi:hypothetical protein